MIASMISGRSAARSPIRKPMADRISPPCASLIRRCAPSLPMVRTSVVCTPRTQNTGAGFPNPVGCMAENASTNASVISESSNSRSYSSVGINASGAACARMASLSRLLNSGTFLASIVNPAACACPPKRTNRSRHVLIASWMFTPGIDRAEPTQISPS